ncbi:ABC transporter permease subunit [Nocardia noduli]|uniref:ABC transporter permease subunit n=1 Tax=Nocardia noduli TaxID=2815722 RepID=UPI001C2395D2|nr:ABC transporter permease subunit [Nocardia noduli]
MWWAQIRSEVAKMVSVRSLAVLPVIAFCVAPAVAVLVGLTESLPPDDTVFGGASSGAVLGVALIGGWGALLVTTEYSAGTMRAVLAATPRRFVVLGAKAAVAASVATIVGCAATGAAVLLGRAVLDSTRYPTGAVFPALFGIAFCYTASACLGVAVAALVRSSAAAVAIMLAVPILPDLIGPLFGESGRWISGSGPAAVVAELASGSDAPTVAAGWLGGWGALVALCGFVVIGFVGAVRLFEARDV